MMVIRLKHSAQDSYRIHKLITPAIVRWRKVGWFCRKWECIWARLSAKPAFYGRSNDQSLSKRKPHQSRLDQSFVPGPNPCRQVKVVKQDNQRVRFLSTEEAKQLLEKLSSRSRQVHDETLLALFCGLRTREVFYLTWGDVDFENRRLFIKDTKNRKLDRFAFMTNEVENVLKSRRPHKPAPNALVFPTSDGCNQKSVSPLSGK